MIGAAREDDSAFEDQRFYCRGGLLPGQFVPWRAGPEFRSSLQTLGVSTDYVTGFAESAGKTAGSIAHRYFPPGETGSQRTRVRSRRGETHAAAAGLF